jgi:DNA-directed RNA polymerase specialized sigma24 family protein
MVAMFARAAPDTAPEADVDLAVARFGPELYGLALAITANRADADDAYQSAWVAGSNTDTQALIEQEAGSGWTIARLPPRPATSTPRSPA